MSNKKEAILEGLNDKQQEAVKAIDGPVLILAGAGSGKTRALTHRIAYLIESGIRPENILAVTFTNKAAGEMKSRVTTLLGGRATPTVGTFHSVSLKMLRADIEYLGYGTNFIIYDGDDQHKLLKGVIEDLGMDPKRTKYKTMSHKISNLKSELVTAQQFEDKATEYTDKILSQVYTEYQNNMRASNAVDFDDLIMLAVRLFREYPQVIEKYQKQFKYIMIDEYQDTNHAQYVWAAQLAKKHRNIAVVGDDAQSIYGWRQADIRNILNFEEDYPEAVVIKLEQNYRSTQKILTAANALIANNENQKKKNLWTNNEDGDHIFVKESFHEREEGAYVVDTINNDLKGKNLHTVAVLYRTHAQSRSIEEALIHEGLPYRIVGGVKFYERREVKDILAYLKLIINANDSVGLKRIYNVPTRGIGTASFKKFKEAKLAIVDIEKNSQLLGSLIGKRQVESLKNLSALINLFDRKSRIIGPSKLIKELIATIKYEKYINDGTDEGEARWENVKELLTAAKKFDKEDPRMGLEHFLEEVVLLQETDKLVDQEKVVTLMTLHSAKGLEFPVVFMVGMEDGLFPHSRALFDLEQLEEERRLCYVGVTRAQNQLHLVYCRRRNIYGTTHMNPPSRFVFELPEEVVTFIPTNNSSSDWEYIIDA